MNQALLNILALVHEGLVIGEVIPQSAAAAALADKLVEIAKASVQEHLAITGAPLDLTLLKPVDPT